MVFSRPEQPLEARLVESAPDNAGTAQCRRCVLHEAMADIGRQVRTRQQHTPKLSILLATVDKAQEGRGRHLHTGAAQHQQPWLPFAAVDHRSSEPAA